MEDGAATLVGKMRLSPGQAVRIQRTGLDGKERIAFIGYIGEIINEGDQLRLTVHAPEKLITDRVRPPFDPPFSDHVTAPQVFNFWWKQLDYVFGLPNPRSFPPLPALATEELDIVRRYVRVAAELAESGVLNALREGFNVQWPSGPTGPEEIEKRFSRKDLQVGFAGLLRQCDSSKEPAHYERVRGILWIAANAAQDDKHDERIKQLRAWSHATKELHKKSLNQLLRDKLVQEEGLSVFEYDEEHSPAQLLSIYNYGELLHWDKNRDIIAEFERDEYVESDRRLAYLEAAGALGHLYSGFGELARHGIGEAR